MYLNTDPIEPLRKPCMRDMNELIHVVLTEPLIMLTPLAELARRLHEITAKTPRFQEEAPLVLQGEAARRQRFQGLRPAPAPGQPQVA